jgi:hypothetical protein
MSPAVTMALSLRSWTRALRTPAAKVFAALMRMRAQGIPLRYGEPGVSWRLLPRAVGGGLGAWQLTNAGGVSLLGAVALTWPLDLGDDPAPQDPGAHLARVLEQPDVYVSGLDEGWHREAHMSCRLHHIHREAYLCGYETGMEARFRATVLCSDCGARRFRPERVCPSCRRST